MPEKRHRENGEGTEKKMEKVQKFALLMYVGSQILDLYGIQKTFMPYLCKDIIYTFMQMWFTFFLPSFVIVLSYLV